MFVAQEDADLTDRHECKSRRPGVDEDIIHKDLQYIFPCCTLLLHHTLTMLFRKTNFSNPLL